MKKVLGAQGGPEMPQDGLKTPLDAPTRHQDSFKMRPRRLRDVQKRFWGVLESLGCVLEAIWSAETAKKAMF